MQSALLLTGGSFILAVQGYHSVAHLAHLAEVRAP